MAIKVLQKANEPIIEKVETPKITSGIKVLQPVQQTTPFGGGGGGMGSREVSPPVKPTFGGTIKNIGAQVLTGLSNVGENILDTAVQLGTSKLNPIYKATPDKFANIQKIGANIVKEDRSQETLNKLGLTQEKQKTLDEKSVLKSYGLGGQLVQGATEMIPNIALGNIGGTAAGIAALSTTAFGGGVDEAYKSGANRDQATAYGLLNAAVENATEFMTGGIPGVKTKWLSGFDKIAEKGISNISRELLQAAVRAGYKIAGEGAEEALSTILNPIIKNATYTKGEKVNWEQVADDGLKGAILGGILNLPSTVSELSNGAKVDKLNIQKAKDLSTLAKASQQTITPTSTITPTTSQTTQGVANIQPQEQVNTTINEIKGNTPLRVYHGSPIDSLTQLDIAKSGTNTGAEKGVLYFTENKKFAEDFAYERIPTNSEFIERKGKFGKVYEAELDIKNPLNLTNLSIDDAKNISNLAQQKGYKEVTPEYVIELSKYPNGQLLKSYFTNEEIKNLGYDGIIAKVTTGFGEDKVNAYEYGVFDNNQIKLVDKTQPTITPQVTTQEITQPETKQRGVFSTALQNQNIPTEIKSGIKNIDQNYIVITDNEALSKAQQKLTDNGADKSLELFKNKFDNNEKLSKYDIAEATLLYNDAFAKGDTQKALDILTSIAVAGTESGQVSQATSILQRATPDGRLLALQKQLNKINQERNTDLKLDEQDVNNIKNSTNQETLDNSVNKAIENISKKIPKTFKETLREWRYLSMLGNPKTHLRNIFSNVAMKGTSKVKNTLSSVLQDIFLDESQQTRTLKKSSKEVIDFAKQDAEAQKSRIQGSDKYDLGKGKIKPAQNKLSAFNSNALEFEDWLFSSSAYSQSLANYITSKNLDVNNITPKQLEEARQYAVDQAQEVTFRKTSKIANAISQFEKKNLATEILVGSTLPFKTTPINIAKTGVEYSPIGLIKTITKNTYDLKQGKISPSQYIDNLSKGLTGTGITALGYLLAEMGLLTASGSDEDKEKYFQQMQGKQPYSIKIGNKTITLDWLSPSAMPFFMGAEISEMKKNGTSNDKLLNIASGLATIVDPLTEMSMLQGLNKTLKSYKDNALGGVLTNTLENYALQYIPTISGQIARTLTPDRKSTTGAGTGITKEFNTFLNKAKAKIPVIANTLEPYTDQFGNKEITRSIAERAFQNFLSPAYIKTTKTDKVYKEIQKLYDKTGETSILPTSSSRYFTQDGQKIYLTPKEYTKFNTIDGQNSLKELSNFFNSQIYKEMNDEERVSAIESFYRASQQIAKERYKN